MVQNNFYGEKSAGALGGGFYYILYYKALAFNILFLKALGEH